MKKIVLIISLCSIFMGHAQSLPINFEGDVTTADLIAFDEGTATSAEVTANPLVAGINTSSTVGKVIRDGGPIYAGAKIELDNNLDFSVLTKISMKVYTTAPVGTIVKFKLEGSGAAVDVNTPTTVSGEWETLEWVFVGTPNTLNVIVFMFDYGNVGDGSANSTFYFDDIAQVTGPTAPVATTLPISFEAGIVSTDFLSSTGATVSVVSNPQASGINVSNTVGKVVKAAGEFWAGSKVFLTNNLDLSSLWKISMKIYTTAPIGTRIKLELEGADGKTNLDYLTTTTGEWEIASWNFNRQATKSYDKLIISFDFGKIGDGSATSTFFFDDIQQESGPAIPAAVPTTMPVDFEASVVTSDFINEDGGITTIIPNPYVDANNPSATVAKFVRSGGPYWAKSKLILTDNIDFRSLNTLTMKVYTDAPIGTVLKLKVESLEPGAFADERDAITTVSGAWETYTWSFPTEVPPLYSVFSFMLGTNVTNDASANATFLFDDIQQTTTLSTSDNQLSIEGITAYPNPASKGSQLIITSKNKTIKSIVLFNVLGRQVLAQHPNSLNTSIKVNDLASGIYMAKILTPEGTGSMKIIIE